MNEDLTYIELWDSLIHRRYDGFVVKEDDLHYYLIYPFHYVWLKRNRLKLRPEWLISYEKGIYHPLLAAHFTPTFQEDEWIFSYPLNQEEDMLHMGEIANFFEHYLFYKKERDFPTRLGEVMKIFKPVLPFSVMNRVAFFILKNEIEKKKIR